MTVREELDELLGAMAEERQRMLLEFARFLSQNTDQSDWRTFARMQFARAYGDDEPEYDESDIRPEPGR